MHISHPISKRSLLIVLFAIVALILGGMAWATRTTLQLDAERRMTEQREAFESKFAMAMYRLDTIDGRFRQEKTHSFDVFKPFYRPPRAFDPRTGAELTTPVLIPSPLQNLDGPDWLLCHFQAMDPNGWDSPQVGPEDEFATSASLIPVEDRDTLCTPANWFTALRTRYEPAQLWDLLEKAQFASLERDDETGLATSRPAEGATQDDKPFKHSRAVEEYNRRRERLLKRFGRHVHTEACERQSIIMANLLPGLNPAVDIDPTEDCRPVVGTPMVPVWLDVTMDGNIQLALMRFVSLPRTDVTEPMCVIQGVLFDWGRLRAALEHEVQDLLPGASVVPVEEGAPPSFRRLHTIPAELIAEMPATPSMASTTFDVVWGLGVAWIVLLVALSAIVYGTIKYLGMLERRMRFTAAVTHELRTPLTSFQLYADLLAELGDDDHERRRKYLDTLRSESKRLSNLVENVLVYSKVNEAPPRVHIRAVRPTEILENLRTDTAQRCEESDRKLVINDHTQPDVTLETDPEFVRQILASLVDNACKYSDAAGPIWVDVSASRGGGVSFEVDDAGSGVVSHETRAVFEPFRRGRDADHAGGMGLGLALSRYWATCLDGKLTIKRSERNGGHFSRFALDLPSKPQHT